MDVNWRPHRPALLLNSASKARLARKIFKELLASPFATGAATLSNHFATGAAAFIIDGKLRGAEAQSHHRHHHRILQFAQFLRLKDR